jgi:release factor glutamine methyltransferase
MMTETKDEPWTVLRLLEWTTDFFKRRGSETPRLDAEILLAHARRCARIALYTSFAEVPSEEQLLAFREMVRRRGEGMPVAQLVGYREFYSLRFRVNEHVLIPRPETEHVVMEVLDHARAMASASRPLRILDLGTGSGAIAVSVAKHLHDVPGEVQIVAVDRSSAALEIARWNAEQHDAASLVRFLESNWFAALEPDERFDIICSNPPYVSESEYAELPATVRDYEPREALVAGESGTEIIEQILAEAAHRLRPGGRLVVELSPMIAAACLELAETNALLVDPRLIKDLDGNERVLSVGRSTSNMLKNPV